MMAAAVQLSAPTLKPGELTALKLGAPAKRLLVLIMDRRAKGLPFPTTDEVAAAKIAGGGRSAPRIYRELEEKGITRRTESRFASGYFTVPGLAVAAAIYSMREHIPSKHKRMGFKLWRPEMGMRTVHENTRRSASMQPPIQNGVGIVKLGPKVVKGWLKGASMHYLTLEERATCPASCALLDKCYGDSMGRTVRYKHDEHLIDALDDQMRGFNRTPRPRLIRLHELGDFYSTEYVSFWSTWLHRYSWLNVFGFTAWGPETEIGAEIGRVRNEFHRRFAVRYSNSTGAWTSTVVAPGKSLPLESFWCPEQSGRVPNCGSCGACWGTEKRVAFKEH